MSAVTYRDSYVPAAEAVAAPRKKGLFARMLDALIEARTQQAAREIELYFGRLPEGLRRDYEALRKSA